MILHLSDEDKRTLQLTILGDLLYTNPALTKAKVVGFFECETNKNSGWTLLRLDLTEATRIDSVGLNVLAMLSKEARKYEAKTIAVIKHLEIQRMLSITRLDSQIEVILVD